MELEVFVYIFLISYVIGALITIYVIFEVRREDLVRVKKQNRVTPLLWFILLVYVMSPIIILYFIGGFIVMISEAILEFVGIIK